MPKKNNNFLNFDLAKAYVHSLELESSTDWIRFNKSGIIRNGILILKPYFIPSNPPQTYHRKWKDWKDWIGPKYNDKVGRGYREKHVVPYIVELNTKTNLPIPIRVSDKLKASEARKIIAINNFLNPNKNVD